MPTFKTGTTTIAISRRNYERLEGRLEYPKEKWDSVVGRTLDLVEEYEKKYGKLVIPE